MNDRFQFDTSPKGIESSLGLPVNPLIVKRLGSDCGITHTTLLAAKEQGKLVQHWAMATRRNTNERTAAIRQV